MRARDRRAVRSNGTGSTTGLSRHPLDGLSLPFISSSLDIEGSYRRCVYAYAVLASTADAQESKRFLWRTEFMGGTARQRQRTREDFSTGNVG